MILQLLKSTALLKSVRSDSRRFLFTLSTATTPGDVCFRMKVFLEGSCLLCSLGLLFQVARYSLCVAMAYSNEQEWFISHTSYKILLKKTMCCCAISNHTAK
jgi:hypothetical protein